MRTTLNLETDVYEAARALARASSRPLGAVVSDLVRRALRPERPDSGVDVAVIDVPADAEVIACDRASDLLAEEGLD